MSPHRATKNKKSLSREKKKKKGREGRAAIVAEEWGKKESILS